MKGLFYLFFIIFCAIILIGAAVSVIVFIFDIIKWHPKEQRVKVVPSAAFESEVIADGRRDDNSHSGSGSDGVSEPDLGNNDNNSDNFGDNFF